jgi:sialic acid synthase SpsE
MAVKIVAEIGACHDGDLSKAYDLIYAVRDAGADYVKAQYWSSAKRLAERRHSGPGYEEIYARYQIPADWLEALENRTRATGLGFMATCYLPEDIAVVEPHVDHFKVASFEAADMDFIRCHYAYAHRASGRWIIVSTGLQGEDTLRPLMAEREAAGNRGVLSVTMKLLHCISAYPAPVDHLHLRQIRTMRFDGFSDHAAAGWIASGAVAVALGAKILEVHLRLPETDEQNPDAPHALLPGQLRRYIEHVRTAEAAIGEESWRSYNPAEDEMRKYRIAPGQP